jgi:allophanate hydrolase
LRVGILTADERVFHGDTETERLYDKTIARLADFGAVAVPIDYAPFREIASLLYDGPWVTERLAAVEGFFATNERDIDPSVRQILHSARRFSAVDAFRARYKLEAFRRRTEEAWTKADVLLIPTVPRTYTVAEMRLHPIKYNSNLGQYTNFTNLLGLAAIAVPAGFKQDGLPAGVTLVGPAWSDDALAPLADALHRACYAGMGVDKEARIPEAGRVAFEPDTGFEIAVVGAHLSGLALNHQLTSLGGVLVKTTTTAADYKLYALPGTEPAKPGLLRVMDFEGDGVEIEIWRLEATAFANFVAAIPAPLGIGKITLQDQTTTSGFLCEAHAVTGAQDITSFGGWRAHVAAT